MKISEELKRAGQHVIKTINEVEVEYLGLLQNTADVDTASFIENEKYLDDIGDNVRVVITNQELAERIGGRRGVCVVDNPKISFFLLHNFLVSNCTEYVLKKTGTRYGAYCDISSRAQIASENVLIGNNVTIEENVVIYENTIIEDDAVIHAGCIIGGIGFECKKNEGAVFTVKHAGSVKIGQGSEIGYNTCVAKALYPWDCTQIGDYCRIDNLVQISHGVKIGARGIIAAGSKIAGRVVIGDDVWLGIGCTVSNGLYLGNNSKVDIGSVVIRNVKDNCEVFGNPARALKNI
ncbi:MAG: UDP-3-O-(3-hydroxymyristoyl)glucosamine N-acyltransferase [Lachnospiraceae bacterium]|nr:UDP-3-O-(3-hydroxymyristoyl)glucosamine N-acyltransferase [Lachnospiraceae bacterium]